MSNHDLGNLPTSQWRAALGASVLPVSSSAAFLRGTDVSGARTGAGPRAIAMCAVGRRRLEAALAAAPVGVPAVVLAPAGVQTWALGTAQLDHPAHNQTRNGKQYTTSVNADGGSAADPPRRREPA